MIQLWASKRMLAIAPIAALAILGGLMVACGDDDDDDTRPTAAATTAVSSPASTSSPAASPTTQPTTTTPAASPTQQSAGTTIRVEDNVFVPGDATVSVGSRVTWQWAGQLPHSVEGTFNGEEVKSDQQTSGAFSFTFDSAGTFEYICGVHGQAMSGRIVVQ